jgi:hypothetical protein
MPDSSAVAAPLVYCNTVRRRMAHDQRQGLTTSQRTIEFIWRTCSCTLCRARRALRSDARH